MNECARCKQEFINYTKDVINSTFKVTKFDQKKKKEDERASELGGAR